MSYCSKFQLWFWQFVPLWLLVYLSSFTHIHLPICSFSVLFPGFLRFLKNVDLSLTVSLVPLASVLDPNP